MNKPTIGEMRVVKQKDSAWLTELEIFDGEAWQPVPVSQGLSDQQIIQAATNAGLCFPQCWALDMEQEDWGEQERSQMAKLRHFTELLKAL